ncbi:hypothetical protein SUDANB171_03069 [Streptomyces sp. enrichment culture]|uniref:NUDIX hydrolase n=1 Tax=Streptomyces sp. enrichment culture TaxID=1795815 RepID=UPI003F57131C
MGNGQWFPAEWAGRVREFVRGEITPAVPRRAATVLLTREGPGGPQVFLLRRRLSMGFAAGAYAYPGGGVDPRDAAADAVAWAGPGREEWAERLGVDADGAQAIVCAAVRETFEESGVLLAGPDPHTVADDTTGPGWEADRAALAARELSLAALLARHSLVLRSDLLTARARWITPEFEPRRYDTWFFSAALPAGQRTRNASTEADRTLWLSPAEALAGYARGEMIMMPPTVATLRQLADGPHPAPAGPVEPVLVRLRTEGHQIVLSWPGHDEFERRVER